jgi:type IV pilus assembly protein PilC
MRFRYKAIDENGKKIRGFVEAGQAKDAASYLRQRNLIPIEISENKELLILKKVPFGNKVKSKDLVFFTRQLSSMLASGLTLIKCLQILKDQLSNKVLQETIGGCLLDLEEGKPFSEAIAKYPDIFSPVYVSLVRAGEASGVLDKVFLRLATTLEKQQKLKNKVKGALVYPVIVITLMIIVTFILMVVVIPQLSKLYDGLGVTLPFATRVVVGASSFVGNVWPLLIGITVVAIYGFLRWKRTPNGRETFDRQILKLPLFGKIIRESILTEFSRTLGLLVSTGTLIVDALNQSAGVAGNRVYEIAVYEVSKKVEKGIPIGEALESYSVFPPLLVQLVRVGEETGKIDENLLKASEYFEEEVDQSVKTLTTAMEPIIMIILGLVVGFLVFSVITPIYGLLSHIG